MRVDLLFLAANRLAFTRESWGNLLRNTDWDQIQSLSVYDDDSHDGTREYLRGAAAERCGSFHPGKFGGPVHVMRDWLPRCAAPFVAKIDNDTIVPPGWLEPCLRILTEQPTLDLLGIEAFSPSQAEPRIAPPGAIRTYRPAPHVGGIGVFRRSAFRHGLPAAEDRPARRWFGFTAWQQRQDLSCGWLEPSLPVFLLDRLPFEPWRAYSDLYESVGWQRPWPRYTDAHCVLWNWRFPEV